MTMSGTDKGLADFAAVLLDMDGVVLDSMGQHAACWREVMAAEGFDASLEFILQNEGCLGFEVLAELAGGAGGLATANDVALRAAMERMLAAQRRMFIERCAADVAPFPAAVELIEWLGREGVPTALVTSSRLEVVRGALGAELAGQFACIVSADEVARHKPHPEPYLRAASKLGLGPSSCLVIENAPAGIRSAQAAGATCYAVGSTLAAHHLAMAHRVFADLAQLTRHLRGRD